MKTVDLHFAKANFPRLVDAAAGGEEIIIAKAGKATAMLVPIKPAVKVRRFGGMKGQIKIADDFDAALPEDVLASFEGS